MDLLVLRRMEGFDVVLAMDWLCWYYVTIECESRVINFREPGQKEFAYWGQRSSPFAITVSITRAKKSINSGCEAYLAIVVNERVEPLVLEDIQVAQEYPNVFLKELQGKSPNREISGKSRWLELLKDYDISILYHLWKANVMANALSRKSVENLAMAITD